MNLMLGVKTLFSTVKISSQAQGDGDNYLMTIASDGNKETNKLP